MPARRGAKHEERAVIVLKRDATAARDRWVRRGWTHVSSAYTANGDVRLLFTRKRKADA